MTTEKGPGYSQIDNKTLEKLARCKIFSNSARVLFVIIRLVNGYLETLKEIRVSVIAERTGIEEANVRRSLRELKADKIIVRNGNLTGIIGAVVYLKEGGLYSTPHKRSNITYKGVKYDTNGGSDSTPYKEKTKQKLLNKGVYATQLSEKEINALEGPEWFRAAMFWSRGFEIDFIEKVLKEYGFHKCMSCWYIFIEATNIKNKTGFFFSLLEKYQEEE
jgi:phage replication O-like protein O